MTAAWRDQPLTRIAGSAISWFIFTACFTLLFQISLAVMALGGSCASGGPYQIAVQCPDNVWLAPVSIWAGLGSVALSVAIAQGFGTPLTTWAWPILFVGLGGAFLASFVIALDITGLIIGIMFVVMGLIPLAIELRASPQRVFLGSRDAAGTPFAEGERARPSLLSRRAAIAEDAVPVAPRARDWALSLAIVVDATVAGVATANAWLY